MTSPGDPAEREAADDQAMDDTADDVTAQTHRDGSTASARIVQYGRTGPPQTSSAQAPSDEIVRPASRRRGAGTDEGDTVTLFERLYTARGREWNAAIDLIQYAADAGRAFDTAEQRQFDEHMIRLVEIDAQISAALEEIHLPAEGPSTVRAGRALDLARSLLGDSWAESDRAHAVPPAPPG